MTRPLLLLMTATVMIGTVLVGVAIANAPMLWPPFLLVASVANLVAAARHAGTWGVPPAHEGIADSGRMLGCDWVRTRSGLFWLTDDQAEAARARVAPVGGPVTVSGRKWTVSRLRGHQRRIITAAGFSVAMAGTGMATVMLALLVVAGGPVVAMAGAWISAVTLWALFLAIGTTSLLIAERLRELHFDVRDQGEIHLDGGVLRAPRGVFHVYSPGRVVRLEWGMLGTRLVLENQEERLVIHGRHFVLADVARAVDGLPNPDGGAELVPEELERQRTRAGARPTAGSRK